MPTSEPVPADHLTRPQVAELLGATTMTVGNWIKAERLVPYPPRKRG